jgi:tetratricopeptide (TPR) repeat protein
MVGAFAFTASVAWGADATPWKVGAAAAGAVPGAKPADAAPAPAPAAPAAPAAGDLKSELSPAQYKSLIKPIEDAIAEAERVLDLAKKNAEKPQDKPGATPVATLKLKAVDHYLSAANKAKSAATHLSKDKDAAKTAIGDQFEKPSKQKAIDLLLELAKEAMDKKDYATAVALYKRVVAVDPDNAAANDGFAEIAKDLKTAQANAKNGQAAGGDNKNTNPNLAPYLPQNYNGQPINGWSHYGQKGNVGGYGGGW